jgi:hypothetical protein
MYHAAMKIASNTKLCCCCLRVGLSEDQLRWTMDFQIGLGHPTGYSESLCGRFWVGIKKRIMIILKGKVRKRK